MARGLCAIIGEEGIDETTAKQNNLLKTISPIAILNVINWARSGMSGYRLKYRKAAVPLTTSFRTFRCKKATS